MPTVHSPASCFPTVFLQSTDCTYKVHPGTGHKTLNANTDINPPVVALVEPSALVPAAARACPSSSVSVHTCPSPEMVAGREYSALLKRAHAELGRRFSRFGGNATRLNGTTMGVRAGTMIILYSGIDICTRAQTVARMIDGPVHSLSQLRHRRQLSCMIDISKIW